MVGETIGLDSDVRRVIPNLTCHAQLSIPYALILIDSAYTKPYISSTYKLRLWNCLST